MSPPPPTLAMLHAELAGLVSAGARLAAATPPPWAALLAGVGVVFLLHGARQRHVLALLGGAALGLAAVRAWLLLASGPGVAVQGEMLWIAGGVGALACGAWPPLFPALAGAAPGILMGIYLPLGLHPALGALLGAVVGGAVGALAREWVAALAAGGLGAAAALAGGLGLLSRRALGAALLAHPWAVLAVWAILAVAGAAFHAGRAWPAPRRPIGDAVQGDLPLHDRSPEHDWRG